MSVPSTLYQFFSEAGNLARFTARFFRINTSSALWKLLNEDAVPHSIVVSVANLQAATGKALHMVKGLDAIVTNVQDGKAQ